MTAATDNIVLEVGTTDTGGWVLEDDLGDPMDLTGFAARMMVRATWIAAGVAPKPCDG